MAAQRPRKILVPIDFSHESMSALDIAMHASCESGARLLLLHVLPTNWCETDCIAYTIGSLEDENSLSAREHLNFLCHGLRQSGIAAAPVLRHGDPAEEIVKAAIEQRADRIIMSSRDRGNGSTHSRGRTAERVLQRAPCEVWCVRRRPTRPHMKASIGNSIPVRAAG